MAALGSDSDVQCGTYWLKVVRAVYASANEKSMLYGNMTLYTTCEGLQVVTTSNRDISEWGGGS